MLCNPDGTSVLLKRLKSFLMVSGGNGSDYCSSRGVEPNSKSMTCHPGVALTFDT